MFVHSVKTPRQLNVTFDGGVSMRGNRLTLLTGPNGTGKTDVLATIADVFHGAKQHSNGAWVEWSRGGVRHIAESLRPYHDQSRGRVRVIAQTFSPFSRFPGIEINPPSISPVYARGHSTEEEYVCIGFHQNSRVELNMLTLSIVENGIIRLSEQPKAARVAFDVLEELGFKEGIDLSYVASKQLFGLMDVSENKNEIEKVLEEFLRTGHFIVDGKYIGKNKPEDLRDELRRHGVSEVAEFVRGSIQLVRRYSIPSYFSNSQTLETFEFKAFENRHSMSSDYPILQAFSFLRRLKLLQLSRCVLTPYQGARVDLTRTSSGQQQMLCSIFGLASALEDDAIVLIDEPELSLHPRWQMNFFKHLETALESAADCHVIVATHSPLIAQAAVEHGAEIIQMRGGAHDEIEHLKLGRTNSSVEQLLVDVFDTPIPHSLHISNEIFGLVTEAEAGTYSERYRALVKLEEYLKLYRQHGEGSQETIVLLVKAIRLLTNESLSVDGGGQK